MEIDLIVERPGNVPLFIEIKSSSEIKKENISAFIRITKEFGQCEAVCFSQDPYRKKYEHVTVYPWAEGIKLFFEESKS